MWQDARVARLHLSGLSFHDEPNRDYVLTMNVLLAVGTGLAAALYVHLGWWSAAIAVGLLALLELSLLSRATAWFAIIVGTAFSAGIGAVGGMALAAALTNARAIWWMAGGGGVVVGAWLAIDAHRKLRAAKGRAVVRDPTGTGAPDNR